MPIPKPNLTIHYDNNAEVIKELGEVGRLFGK